MARIICQVVPRADRLTFIWSDGAASFAPYHLAGSERATFDSLASQARTALAERRDGTELAGLGHRLYRALFRLDATDGASAQEISRWLGELIGQGQVESLEFLGDRPGRVPWNLLLDRAATGSVGWDAFWGARNNVAAGRRTNPLRYSAPLVQPTPLLAADASLLGEVTGAARSRLEAWDGERLIVDVADQLSNQLRRRTPDVLILAARVEGDGLRIGSERITPAQLQTWIAEAEEGNPNPVIFLAAVGGAEQAPTWDSWLAAASASLDGLVTSIVPLPANDAILAVLTAAERFVQNRRPLVAAAADARAALGAVGAALTVFCPPGLRVAESAEAEPAIALPRQPLPDFPYCPLRPYGPEERPLFFGREEEMLRLAALIDDERTAGVIVHGTAAVGKTSLIQAGIWPYLEQESVGYRVLCDRTPDETATAEEDYPPLSLRPGRDLAGQLVETLLAFCAQPLTYTSPTGATVRVDLPEIVRAQMGLPPSTAIQAPQPLTASAEQAEAGIAEPGHAPPPESEETEPGARELWLALREDPVRLGRLLDEVTRQLPYDLVITIDEGEELLTLVDSATERERRRQALEMLMALAESAARCKVLLVLRTEYFGQLAGMLPARSGRALWQEFFVDELSDAAMIDAVIGPTSREPIPYAEEVPYEKYGFAYEEGMAQQIVQEVIREGPAQQGGALSLLQVVCATLYEQRVQRRRQALLRPSDLRDIGGVHGVLGRYVQEQLNRLPLPAGTRGKLRDLMRHMVTRHGDGRVTRDLVAARELKTSWKDATPIEQAVNTAAEQSGLFAIDELLVAGQPGLYVSLAHDAVAQASRQWDGGVAPAGAKRSGVVDTLWVVIPLALLACVLTWYFTRRHFAGQVQDIAEAVEKEQQRIQEAVQEFYQATRRPLYRGQIAEARQLIDNSDALGARQLLLSSPAVASEMRADMRGFEWDYLWNRANSQRHDFEGHLGTVHAVAVSGDGRLAASAAADGTVRLWNLARGQAAALIQVGTTPLYAVALSSDGKTVAAGGADKKVHVFDVGTLKDEFVTISKESQTLAGHEGDVLALAFDKEGKTLASGGADKTAILWDVKAGKPRATLKDHTGRVQALAFAADGKTLATGGAEVNVLLWNAESAQKTHTFDTGYSSVSALAFAPDGKTLAIGGATQQASVQAGTVRFWDIGKSAVQPGTAFHGQDVLALAYLPGGKIVASAGKDALIRLWDSTNAHEAGHFAGHLGWVDALAITGDGTLVSGSYDRSVKAWDIGGSRATQVLHGHKDWVQAVAFGGGLDQVLASGGKDGLVKLWDPLTGASLGELSGHKGAVTALAFALHRPTMLAVGTWDGKGGGEIRLWELVRVDKSSGYKGKELHTLTGHKGGITALEFSPDPRGRLASAAADKAVILWDTDKGKPLHTLGGKQAPEVRALSYSAGALLLTGGTDGMIRAWDTEAGKLVLGPYAAHTDTINAVSFIRLPSEEKGRDIPGCITGGLDHLLQVTTIEKNEFVGRGTTRASNHPITSMVAQPGRSLLLSGGWDGTVRLWAFEIRGAKGEPARIEFSERFSFTGHTGPVRAVAMSLRQPILASGGDDGTVRIWRGATSRPIRAVNIEPKQAK